MPNKRTGQDYIDYKNPPKKKKESLLERLKRQKEEKQKLIDSM